MEYRQRANRLGRGGGVAEAPELLGRGTHHAVLHLLHRCVCVNLFGSEGAHQRLVTEGVRSRAFLERYRADRFHILFLARERTHHVEHIAIEDILVFGSIHRPLHLHHTGIFQLLGGAVIQQLGSEVERFVHQGIVLVVNGLGHRAHQQLCLDGQALVLLGGRQQDEACIGVLGAIHVDGLRLAVLVGVSDIKIFHGLIAREWHLHLAFLTALRAWHDVVSCEVHVVGCRPRLHDGHRLAVNHLPGISLLSIHLIRQGFLVGDALAATCHLAPVVGGDDKGTATIVSPEFGSTIIIITNGLMGNTSKRDALINTMEIPFASRACPSDKGSAIGIGPISCDRTIRQTVRHVYLRIASMSDESTNMTFCNRHISTHPYLLYGEGGR